MGTRGSPGWPRASGHLTQRPPYNSVKGTRQTGVPRCGEPDLDLCPAGDRHDQRPAGAHGQDGERLQSGHQEHHLRGPAGLCPGDAARAPEAGGAEEEERSYQVGLPMALFRGTSEIRGARRRAQRKIPAGQPLNTQTCPAGFRKPS